MIITTRPHPPGDTEVMRNNESHWSGLNNNSATHHCLDSYSVCIQLTETGRVPSLVLKLCRRALACLGACLLLLRAAH